jgi:hypothetical protein
VRKFAAFLPPPADLRPPLLLFVSFVVLKKMKTEAAQ